jgi:hypothetical protein
MSDYQLAPMPRANVIRLSLRAFVCGLFGVLPVIGLVPGLYAVYCWAVIRKRYPTEWNPASNYVSCGAALAMIGLAITVVGIPATILSLQLIELQAGQ